MTQAPASRVPLAEQLRPKTLGEVIGQRIIETREAVGRFSYPEDLLLVPGIGEKRLEAIRGLICFE